MLHRLISWKHSPHNSESQDVKDTRFSLTSFIEEKFRRHEEEIAEIKAALARMQTKACWQKHKNL